MAGPRFLVPLMGVRIPLPQPVKCRGAVRLPFYIGLRVVGIRTRVSKVGCAEGQVGPRPRPRHSVVFDCEAWFRPNWGRVCECEAEVAASFRPLRKRSPLTWENASGRNRRQLERATPAAQLQSRGAKRGRFQPHNRKQDPPCGAWSCQFDRRKHDLDPSVATSVSI